jgi:glycosyltransferase involved in cell wall biosynthesis
MRVRLGWTGKFIALYSGNLGLAHDFDTLVEAVRVLKDGAIQFVFAGEGPQLGSVREVMSPFSHVSFLPPQPRSDLGSFLAAADAHLVTVRAGLSGLVVPSKIYGILAVGRPVLYVGPEESEVAQLLRSSQAGVAVKNGDAAKLADSLLSLAGDAIKARTMGDRARHVSKGFTLDKAVTKWKEVLR